MSGRAKIRSLALLVSSVLLVGTLGSTPAFAEEPTPAPTAEVGESPAPEETPAPNETPVPDETPAPEDTPAPAETDAPDDASTPDAATAGAQEVVYSGFVTRLSNQSHGDDAAAQSLTQLFRIVGFGYIPLDFTAVPEALEQPGTVRVSITVPAGVDLGGSEESKFAALSEYALGGGKLAASKLVKVPTTNGLVNTTPATAAVHKVYAVLVTPSNVTGTVAAADQTAAAVQAGVAHTDAYWNEQSAGAVDIQHMGTATWYKSSYSCATDSGSTNMWAEAANRATAQLGYKDALNTHLALFFPSTASCGGAIGLGSVGTSINSGGVTWSIGTDSDIAKTTLSHEIGHNLSLGHANIADCTVPNPQLGLGTPQVGGTLNNCTGRGYGDIQDVMGFGVAGKTGGALSSPHAIRSGLWGSGSYVNAPKGAKTYALKPVSGNAGLRSVVVEDNLGVNYFVEYRDFTGEDAQYATSGCPTGSTACVESVPNVRVMRLERNLYDFGSGGIQSIKGFPGDDAYLLGRLEGGVRRVGYTAGQSYSTQGITIKVNTITTGANSSASVTVTRAAGNVTAGKVTLIETVGDGAWPWEAGTTLTAFIGASFEAEKYTYKWYRTGKLISGATKQNYTLTGADVNKNIRVVVTATGSGTAKTAADPVPANYGYGPITMGTLIVGQVSTSHSASGVTAVLSNWDTPSTVFAYQWFRNGVWISGATQKTYVPTADDNGLPLTVRVAASKSGYYNVDPVSATHPALTTGITGTLVISGNTRVGSPLSATGLSYTANGASATSLSRTFQWYRATGTATPVAIAGATAETYTPIAADLGKVLTVRVTGGQAGFPKLLRTSAPTPALSVGTIAMSAAVPVVTKAGLVATAAFPAGTITEPSVVVAWKWTRDGAAISGAVKPVYTLTAADYGKQLVAQATLTKPAFTTVVRSSESANHSVLADAAPTVSGTAQVGMLLTSSTPSYSTIPSSSAATVTRQWYRSGVAISGATGATYTLAAADYGKAISVRVVGAVPTFLSAVGTSASTAAVAKGIVAGTKSTATVTKNAAGTVLTATPTAGAITESGVAYAYQWYRNGVAIAKATKSTFALSTLDRSKSLHVRIIVTKLNYSSVTLLSTPTDYSVIRSVAPAFTGDLRVGGTLTVNSATYKTYDQASVAAAPTYQWYRSGVAIAGATGTSYTLVAADYTKLITVRVAASWTGYLPYVIISAASAKVAPGLIAGPNVVPTVARSGMVLTATAGSVGEPGVAYAYQWYRSGAAIAKATKASYTLTSLDAGKTVYVRQLATKLNYTSVALLSVATNYSVQRTVAPVVSIVAGGVRVGGTVGVNASTYFTNEDVVGTTPTYQWYRSGVAIKGATTHSYVLTAADLAKLISVRVVNTEVGYLPYIVTSPAVKVAAGAIQGTKAVPELTKNDATLVVTAALPAGSITETGTKLTWQWYRAGVAIPKATAATFKLTAVDYNKVVHARATVTKSAYTSVVLNSAPVNSSVVPTTAQPIIAGDVALERELTIPARTYTNGGEETYQWFRTGVAIPGATTSAYTPVAADKGRAISVRVTALAYGFLPAIWTSAATQLVGDYAMAGGSSTTTVPAPKDNGVLAITANDTVVTEPGAVKTHQWYRSGVAIAKATAATYTPVAADFGKLISVRVIYTKPTFTSVVRWSTPVAVSVVATGKPVISSTLPKRGVPVTVSTPTFTVPAGDSNVVTVTYQWYRSGKAISGATSATYKPVTADKGKTLTARVVATAPGLVPAILMSAATKALK